MGTKLLAGVGPDYNKSAKCCYFSDILQGGSFSFSVFDLKWITERLDWHRESMEVKKLRIWESVIYTHRITMVILMVLWLHKDPQRRHEEPQRSEFLLVVHSGF